MTQKPNTTKAAADKLVKNIRRKTRQTCSAEEKTRIVLAGLRGEESIPVLCRPLPGRVMQSMIPRGGRHRREPALQLVEGVSGSWQAPFVGRYISSGHLAGSERTSA